MKAFLELLEGTPWRVTIPLETDSSGSPILPAEGNTLVKDGLSYRVRKVVWDYDSGIIQVIATKMGTAY